MVLDGSKFTKVAGKINVFVDEEVVTVDFGFLPGRFTDSVNWTSEDVVTRKEPSLPVVAWLSDIFEEKLSQLGGFF